MFVISVRPVHQKLGHEFFTRHSPRYLYSK